MDKPAATDVENPYYQKILDLINNTKDEASFFKAAVNAPFHDKLQALQLDLGIVVLLMVNQEQKTIDRVELSDTFSAHGAVRMSSKPFRKIKIPLGHKTNLISKAIETGSPQQTENWHYLFVPALTAREAQFNQAGAGIECSYIYPLMGKKSGAVIFSFYQPIANIGDAHHNFMQYYSHQLSNRI